MSKSGLWTAYEAAAATGGALCARGGDPDHWVAEEWAANGISIDTRTLAPGEIFVALQDMRDGHDFIDGAFDRGASAALVARAPQNAPEGKPLLLVRDTMEALRDLARAARTRNFGKRIAVTGSVGKTTTKEMLRAACAEAGRVHAADKSFNNHWGVPLTLARMPLATDFGVFEIGMNHAGEITPLTHLVMPDAAIVTTVGTAHIEFFGTTAKIAEAKAEIFLGVADGGAAILPIDNQHYDILEGRAREAGIDRRITFGESDKADFRLARYETDGNQSTFAFHAFGRDAALTMPSPGKHQAMNALAAIAACDAIGISWEKAIAGLETVAPAGGRGARLSVRLSGGRDVTVLDESYNANPTSMAAAIALLGTMTPGAGGRRIVVAGDMLELGGDAAAFHAGLAESLVAADIDCLYATGGLMRHLFDAVPAAMRGVHARDVGDLSGVLEKDLRDGDIVMVKGSNASKVAGIVRALKGAHTG